MANTAVVFSDEGTPDRKKTPQVAMHGSQQAAPSPKPNEKIKVVGIGGGGNNALNHIIRSGATGVEFLAVNTDAHCLEKNLSTERLVIGPKTTKGLGAGATPSVGREAALESRDQIRDFLRGSDMVYLAAGMGGGTGTGATPVVAKIAKEEMGILTVAVVTRPFNFEGPQRRRLADEGIDELKEYVDALIVVPNERLLSVSERTTTLVDAFAMADNVLRQAVQGVTDLVTRPGFINVDFADLKKVMEHAGGAVMGIGTASGETRAMDALKRAMESPLMETSMNGARGVILNITAHPSVGILEVNEASEKLQSIIDPQATFVWGLVEDETMGETIKMVVIATGFDFDNKGSLVNAKVQAATDHSNQVNTQAPLDSRSSIPTEPFKVESPLDTPSYLRRMKH